MRKSFGILIATLCLIAHAAGAQAACAAQSEPHGGCIDEPEMVEIPAGSFAMGENPSHRVTIGKPFAIGKTEVTQAQWRAVTGDNPGYFKSCGDSCPVEQVSWHDIQEFIGKLNALTGKQYRLPSEAEWEYACRAGKPQEYCGSDHADEVAWYGAYTHPAGSSGKTTNPVAAKRANAFGLYDMSGNVWEWVADGNHENYHGAPTDGSAWAGDGTEYVLRGGSWNFEAQFVRATFRIGGKAGLRSNSFGFRLARTLR